MTAQSQPDLDADRIDRLHGDLLGHLERGDDLAALTSTLLYIEALPADLPRRADLLQAARRTVALSQRMHEYQQKERALRTVFEIARSLTELKNLDEVLLDIVRRSKQLLGCDIAWLAGEDEGDMRVLAIEGAHTFEAREMAVSRNTAIAGYVMRTASTFSTQDYLGDPNITHDFSIDSTLAREGMQSALAAPLLSDSDVIGVLILGDRHKRAYQPWEISTLATLAAHASVAIRNARAFEAERLALKEAERANALLHEKVSQLEISIEAHDRIAKKLSQGGGLQDMADVIADMLHGEIVFMNPIGHEVCVAAPRGESARPPRPHRKIDPAILRVSEDSRSAGRSVAFPDEDSANRIVAVSGGGELLGSLLIRRPDPLGGHEIRIFERGSTAMAVLALHAEKEYASARQDANLALRALLDPGRHDSADLAERARRHGLDLSAPVMLAVVEVADVRAAYVGRKLGDRLRSYPHILTELDDRIVLLINRNDAAAMKAELTETMFSELEIEGVASISPPLKGAPELPEAYRAARRALELLRKLGRGDQVIYEPELSLYAVLFREQSAAELSRMIQAHVGPLLDHDRNRGSALADTFLAYLDNGRNARATARELGLHVNTVYNRIETIHALLGLPEGEEPPLEAHMALRLRRLRDM